MPTKTIIHKKKKVTVTEVHNKKHLFINDEYIPVKAIKKSGPYLSLHLPYQKFSTLHELGKAIVDYRATDEKKKK